LDKADAEQIKAELLSGDPADRRLDEGAHEPTLCPKVIVAFRKRCRPRPLLREHAGDHADRYPTTNQTLNGRQAKVVNTSIRLK